MAGRRTRRAAIVPGAAVGSGAGESPAAALSERTQAHTISPALGLGGVCGATVMLRLLRAQVSQRRASCRHGAEKLGLRVPPAVPATAAAVCRGYACKTDAS
jgi:hypothetical protein